MFIYCLDTGFGVHLLLCARMWYFLANCSASTHFTQNFTLNRIKCERKYRIIIFHFEEIGLPVRFFSNGKNIYRGSLFPNDVFMINLSRHCERNTNFMSHKFNLNNVYLFFFTDSYNCRCNPKFLLRCEV